MPYHFTHDCFEAHKFYYIHSIINLYQVIDGLKFESKDPSDELIRLLHLFDSKSLSGQSLLEI